MSLSGPSFAYLRAGFWFDRELLLGPFLNEITDVAGHIIALVCRGIASTGCEQPGRGRKSISNPRDCQDLRISRRTLHPSEVINVAPS